VIHVLIELLHLKWSGIVNARGKGTVSYTLANDRDAWPWAGSQQCSAARDGERVELSWVPPIDENDAELKPALPRFSMPFVLHGHAIASMVAEIF
jgi:hypothetical protein